MEVFNKTSAYNLANGTNICPPEFPDIVMSRLFYGGNAGCDCLGISHKYLNGDNMVTVGNSCSRNATRYGCREVKPMKQMIMPLF